MTTTATDPTIAVAPELAVPKDAPADSFVLHAPLELLARRGLFPHVRPDGRDAARERVMGLAAEYAAAGDPVAEPRPTGDETVAELAAALVSALDAGELDDVDRFATALGGRATPIELRRALSGPVSASLAAAAHAGIFLYLLPRVAPDGELPGSLLRGAARELGRYPEWRLRWFEDPGDPVGSGSLADALLHVPVLGLPGSDFIYPIMHQAEESGTAARLLAGVIAGTVDVDAARRVITRVAAWSMLQEPPDYAPYGWSHCLTLPQAVMGIAGDGLDAHRAIAVASTYIVGFRAALGRRLLDPAWVPDAPATPSLVEARALGPDAAAATVWHAPADARDGIVTELATYAAQHHDAHLVKYTLACFDAAAPDPDATRLYLAAAASLSGWWATNAGFGDNP
jgi:hypothetical protein